jgi:hypothetical protein
MKEATVNEGHDTHPDERVMFLRALMQEDASIDLDILKFGNDAWAIHGVFPYDGEVPMAVFDSYAEAKQALDEVCGPWRPLRGA